VDIGTEKWASPVTPASVNQRWINFEAGVGLGAGEVLFGGDRRHFTGVLAFLLVACCQQE